VSPAERSVRHGKLRTDRAISQAYIRVAADVRACATFNELLRCIRDRSPRLLDAPVIDGRHLGVEALVNLARFADAYVRTIEDWTGSSASWRGGVHSLAQHLLSRYRIPAFLSAAWYATDDRYAEAKRRWFVGHTAGASFRSLTLPIRLTRKMEHILLGSRDHFGIEYALRRAELLGLGADQQLTDAVLATRPALDMDNGEFWRIVWLFLIGNAGSIDGAQVGPIIDFVHAIRHERVAVDTADGIVMREPPQPQFSLKGRTARSVVRLMDEWHGELGLVTGGLRWEPSRLRPMVLEPPQEDPAATPVSWELTELTNSAQLRAEGVALQHCVASYSHSCWRGASRIWSLRRRRDSEVRSIVTVEVDPARRTVVQARGFRNRRASGKALHLVQTWATRENLRLSL
jgi:PcfJ-like protein